tara:strand:- start:119 stop:334 length:216 start_codon:yes stop_codon:yes gene_type:complete
VIYEAGDLVYVRYLGKEKVLGIITKVRTVKEKNVIDDLWNTVIINENIMYNVLLHGKIIKLTKTFIQEKIA